MLDVSIMRGNFVSIMREQNDISERIRQVAEDSILKVIASGGWIQPDYSNRVQIPKDLMLQVWSMVDMEKVKDRLKDRIESELADRIVNSMAAEIATDIKQVLSIQERREAIRSIARSHMDSIMKLGSGGSK